MLAERAPSLWRKPKAPTYHPKFGGLWIDRTDWRDEMLRRRLSTDEVALITQFAEMGYVIFPQACRHDAIDMFQRCVVSAFREGNQAVLYQDHFSKETRRLMGPVDRLGTQLVDVYIALPEALELFTSPALMRFLKLLFDRNPLLFQSLSFDQGSQQGLHQDTAYVVVNRPLKFAACRIALEDVAEGSGELMYAPGSHRHPDLPFFGPDRKHWQFDPDGQKALDDWHSFLVASAVAPPDGLKTFLAKKGDIFVWHADLAHGGSRVTRRDLTRPGLVGHFGPQSAKPHYVAARPDRATIRHYGDLGYSSEHYDLSAVETAWH
jgi:ectoine hydroxylase-related dioxygenase (phytanoyl-CoA dioxygenase family)